MSEKTWAEMSEKTWAEAWVKCWAEMPDIGQTSTEDTGKFSYTYASRFDILKAVQPILTKHGFAISQSVLGDYQDDRIGVETIITHKDGFEKVFGPLPMPASNDPKVVGSAITYARRYALAAALGIATDEDVDAPAAVQEDNESPRRLSGIVSAVAESAPRTADAHDELWDWTTAQFDTTARTDMFFEALEHAEVKKGSRATKTKAAKAQKYLEALLVQPQ